MIKLKILLILIGLMIAITGILFYGAFQWQKEINSLNQQLETARTSIIPSSYNPKELDNLPPPVQRYFRTVLKPGQPMITRAQITHQGQFNLSETDEQWIPFTSTQSVIPQRPGFNWNARMTMFPGLNIYVRDAYVVGEGILKAKLLGLFTVMEQPSTPELAQGEVMRFFAEAAWYPTALLPSQGISWEAIDDDSAIATLTDDTTTVTLEFHFNEQGLISTVRSEGRYRSVDGVQVAVPWQGRFWDYQERDNMLVPLSGEVAWLPPQANSQPYWRGQITEITYDYGQ